MDDMGCFVRTCPIAIANANIFAGGPVGVVSLNPAVPGAIHIRDALSLVTCEIQRKHAF